jgi:hypothetical protein
MKQYGLFTKKLSDIKSDVIAKIRAYSLDEAITLFSKIKKLEKSNIVDIFDVKEIKERV